MEINKQIKIDINKLAYLARLEISEEEKQVLHKEMEEIVHFASQLSKIQDIECKQNDDLTALKNVFREDVCTNNYTREELMIT